MWASGVPSYGQKRTGPSSRSHVGQIGIRDHLARNLAPRIRLLYRCSWAEGPEEQRDEMSENEIIAGLDLGTTKVCAIVAEVTDEGLDIIGIGSVPSKGLRKGVVVNIESTVQAIRAAIEQAEPQHLPLVPERLDDPRRSEERPVRRIEIAHPQAPIRHLHRRMPPRHRAILEPHLADRALPDEHPRRRRPIDHEALRPVRPIHRHQHEDPPRRPRRSDATMHQGRLLARVLGHAAMIVAASIPEPASLTDARSWRESGWVRVTGSGMR